MGGGRSPPTKDAESTSLPCSKEVSADLSSINWTHSPRLGIRSLRLGEAGSNRHAGGKAEHRAGPGRAPAGAPCQPPATASLTGWTVEHGPRKPQGRLSRFPGGLMNYPISYEHTPFLLKSGRVVICHLQIRNPTQYPFPITTIAKSWFLSEWEKKKVLSSVSPLEGPVCFCRTQCPAL